MGFGGKHMYSLGDMGNILLPELAAGFMTVIFSCFMIFMYKIFLLIYISFI